MIGPNSSALLARLLPEVLHRAFRCGDLRRQNARLHFVRTARKLVLSFLPVARLNLFRLLGDFLPGISRCIRLLLRNELLLLRRSRLNADFRGASAEGAL